MPFETWTTFALVYFLVAIIPGPSILYISNQALIFGREHAFRCVYATKAGDVCLLLIAGTLISLAATVSGKILDVLNWIGLIWLGGFGLLLMLQCKRQTDAEEFNSKMGLVQAFLVGISNPKNLAFYTALLPAFLHLEQGFFGQITLLSATVAIIGAFCLLLYAYLSSLPELRKHKAFQSRFMFRCIGAALMGVTIFLMAVDTPRSDTRGSELTLGFR